jgi:ribonuclease T2
VLLSVTTVYICIDVPVVVALESTPSVSSGQQGCCTSSQPCWPTQADLDELESNLNPIADRSLWYRGKGTPRVCGVPIYSPNDQPLYDAGMNLKPLYVQQTSDRDGTCFVDNFHPEFCLMATRNVPQDDMQPAFIVWPRNSAEVQVAVNFARKHNLCVCVTNTGHDFLNRHSCNEGLMIRTSLLKDIEFSQGTQLNASHGVFKSGAGVVFSELEFAASAKNLFVASGWADTVGLAGWSIGGGHGPFGAIAGYGVDNVLEVEIVTADGKLITANATHNADLLWALRGGGGSTWGVLTSLTVRAHQAPARGFTQGILTANGTACGTDMEQLQLTISNSLTWMASLSSAWSGLMYVTPQSPQASGMCASWQLLYVYVYQGAPDDPEFSSHWAKLRAITPQDSQQYVQGLNPWWQRVEAQPLEPLMPVGIYAGVPSVMLNQSALLSPQFEQLIMDAIVRCNASAPKTGCSAHELFHDIPGRQDSPKPPTGGTSLPSEFRNALVHAVVTNVAAEQQMKPYYDLGQASYFSESMYQMQDWKERYWGAANYVRLLSIKQKYDPQNLFFCRHCVGSDIPRTVGLGSTVF